MEAAIYSAKGINCFLCYINKPQTREITGIMEHSMNLVQGLNTQKAISVLAHTKIRLATMYNALKKRDESVRLSEEAEQLLGKITTKSNDYYSIKGSMYAERGHALLYNSTS